MPPIYLSNMYSVLHSIFQNLTYEIAVVGLVQPPSFSLIDNILCNSLDDAAKSVSGVLITDI